MVLGVAGLFVTLGVCSATTDEDHGMLQMAKVEAHDTSANSCANELSIRLPEDHDKAFTEGLYTFAPDLQHSKTEGRPVYQSTKNQFKLYYDRHTYNTNAEGLTVSRGWVPNGDGVRVGKWCIGADHTREHGYCAIKSEITEAMCPEVSSMEWFSWDRDVREHLPIGSIVISQRDMIATAEQLCLIHCDPAQNCGSVPAVGSYGYENEREHGEAFCASYCKKPAGEDTCAANFRTLPEICEPESLDARVHTENLLDKFCLRNCRVNDHGSDELCHMRDAPDEPDVDLPGVPTFKGRPTYRLGVSDYASAHEHGDALCQELCNSQHVGNEVKPNYRKCIRAHAAVTQEMCFLGVLAELDELTESSTHGYTVAWRQRNGWVSSTR